MKAFGSENSAQPVECATHLSADFDCGPCSTTCRSSCGGRLRTVIMKLPAGHVAGVGVHKATAYGGFGQQMLEKMGWSKGQGLGKEKHGMKEAIEVKKKEDVLGVSEQGAGEKLRPQQGW